MNQQPAAVPQKSIGKYRIDGLLGRGGMGEVYKAYDSSLDRTLALKTIRAEMDDPRLPERFKREGRAAGRLRHPRIVTVYDLGEAEGTLYIAMEYLEGVSLATALHDGRLTFTQRVQVLIQVLEGIAYAHQQGVIHRDIKPANIQILPDSSVKLLDFGVARLTSSESLSQVGAVVGTVFYMAPEQLQGARVDGRADIYSAGVVGYEMFARRRPFQGESLSEIALKIMREPAPPMDSDWSAAFPRVEAIVYRAIQKDAALRYPDAAHMAADLQQFLHAEGEAVARLEGRAEPTVICPPPVRALAPTAPPAAPRPPRRWHPAYLAAAGAAVLVLGGSAALLARWATPLARNARPPAPSLEASPAVAPPTTTTLEASPMVPPATSLASRPARGSFSVQGEGGLAAVVAEALRTRGYLLRGPEGAESTLRVGWRVEVRASPYGSGAARTADYSGFAELRRAGLRRRFEFDGHVMEVGEAVTVAAARRDLGAKVADAMAGVVPLP